MPFIYTTDQLVEQVKRRAQVPGTSADGSGDQDIIDILNDEMRIEMVPFLLDVREEYLAITEHMAIPSAGRLRVPIRAFGGKLRDLGWRQTASDPISNVARIQREDAESQSGQTGSFIPRCYYFEGSDIVFLPLGATFAGLAVVSYFFEPGELVDSTRYRQITAVDTSTGTLTLNATVPTSWSTANRFDVHSPHSGAEISVWSMTATTVSGSTVVLAGDLVGATKGRKPVEVGDYLVTERNAAVPALPRVLHPVLAQAAVKALLEHQGDYEGVQAATATFARMLDRAREALDERNEGEVKVITSRRSVFTGHGARW